MITAPALCFSDADREAWCRRVASGRPEGALAEGAVLAARQPMHTVVGGAQLFQRDLPAKLGRLALSSLDRFARDAMTFSAALGLSQDDAFAEAQYAYVRNKLAHQPVEDYRIDFEDGYGLRSDDEEDRDAFRVARELASAAADNTLPPRTGIRVKSLSSATRERAFRTLDLVISTMAAEGVAPDGFVVMLPKVTTPTEIIVLGEALSQLESKLDLTPGLFELELMVEARAALVSEEGAWRLPAILDAAAGRCRAVHFGTYDYLADHGVSAPHQRFDHPAADVARQLIQLSLAHHDVWLVDGATTRLPVAPHRGKHLSLVEEAENRRAVHEGWRLHAENVTRSLAAGFYQSWDLHPAQLPARFAAHFAFFRGQQDAMAARFRNFVSHDAQATLTGTTFDDAATGKGLRNFFRRALASGAITEGDSSDGARPSTTK